MRVLFYKKSFIFSALSILCLLYAGTCQHGGHYLQVKSEQNKRPQGTENSGQEVAVPYSEYEDTCSPFEGMGRLRGGMEDVKERHKVSGDENKTQEATPSAATEYGLGIHHIDGDGNCLFRAVADQLQKPPFNVTFSNQQDYHSTIRRIAVAQVSNNKALYQDSCYDGFEGVEDWIAKMSKDSCWGGQVALRALSDALQVTIVAVRAEAKLSENPTVYKPASPRGTIYLHYKNRSHYESLSPLSSMSGEQRSHWAALQKLIAEHTSSSFKQPLTLAALIETIGGAAGAKGGSASEADQKGASGGSQGSKEHLVTAQDILKEVQQALAHAVTKQDLEHQLESIQELHEENQHNRYDDRQNMLAYLEKVLAEARLMFAISRQVLAEKLSPLQRPGAPSSPQAIPALQAAFQEANQTLGKRLTDQQQYRELLEKSLKHLQKAMVASLKKAGDTTGASLRQVFAEYGISGKLDEISEDVKKNQAILIDISARIQQPADQKQRPPQNLPAPAAISFFVGRDKELKKVTQALNDKKPQVHLLCGPGGMGKTQLAIQLFNALAQQGQYAHVFWLRAGTQATLQLDYFYLAEKLGIPVDKKDPNALRRIREILEERHCLYVFDDAPNRETIAEFLPRKQGHVLITSRNSKKSDWRREVQCSPLDKFGQQEVVALAQELDLDAEALDEATLKYLLEELSGYPLVLAQFFSFCRQKDYHPTTYVEKLRNSKPSKQDQLLIKRLLRKCPNQDVAYTYSMMQVMVNSLQTLEQEEEGKRARALMSRFSYLDPRGIPLDWILQFDPPEDDEDEEDEIREALSLLERYSLAQWDREGKQVYMHAVTQRIIRSLAEQNGRTAEHLRGTLQLLKEGWDFDYENPSTWTETSDKEIGLVPDRETRLLPHIESIVKYRKQIPKELLPNLSRLLGRSGRHYMFLTSNYKKASEHLNVAREILENESYTKSCDLSQAYQDLALREILSSTNSDYSKAKNYLEQARKILDPKEHRYSLLRAELIKVFLNGSNKDEQELTKFSTSLFAISDESILSLLPPSKFNRDFVKIALLFIQLNYLSPSTLFIISRVPKFAVKDFDEPLVKFLGLNKIEAKKYFPELYNDIQQKISQSQEKIIILVPILLKHLAGFMQYQKFNNEEEVRALLEKNLLPVLDSSCKDLEDRYQKDREYTKAIFFLTIRKLAAIIIKRSPLNQLMQHIVRHGTSANAYTQSSKNTLQLWNENNPEERELLKEIADRFDRAGRESFKIDHLQESTRYYERALKIRQEVCGEYHIDIAKSHSNLGRVYAVQQNYDKAAEHYEQAFNTYVECLGEDHPKTLEVTAALEGLFSERDSSVGPTRTSSVELGDRKAEATEEINMQQIMAASCDSAAETCLKWKEYEQALKHYEEALKLRKALYGAKPHVDLAKNYSHLGQVYLAQKNYTEAAANYKQTHAIYSELLGEEHATTQQVLQQLEDVHKLFSEQDSSNEGHMSEDRSLETVTKKTIAHSYDSAGKTCLKKKDHQQALEHYEQSLKVRLDLYGTQPHADVAKSYMGLGLAYKGLKDYQKAIVYLKKSLAMRLKVYGTSSHASVATIHHNLGNVYRDTGNYEQAEEQYAQALELFKSCLAPIDRRIKLVTKNLRQVREVMAKQQ